MKNYQKVALGTVSVLAAFTLVACGSSAKSKSSSGKTTLHMYQIGDKPDNYKELMANANKILEKKAGVKLDISYIGWGDYAQKMNVIVSSGEAYDIAFAQDYATNAAKGAFADLTDLAPKYAKTAYNELNPAYIEGNKINGKLYGYPVNGNIYAQQVITFNKQYLDKYNLSIDGVDSFASAEKVIEEFHKKDPNVAAFAIGQGFKTPGNVDYVLGNGLPFAVDTTGDGKKIQNVYDIPAYIDNLKKMHDYYTKGLIPADAATSNTAFDLNSNNWFARVETQGPYDYGDTILTQAAGQTLVSKAVTNPLITTDQARMANFVVSNTSKHKEEAVKALGIINSDAELLNGLVYGVETQGPYDYGDTILTQAAGQTLVSKAVTNPLITTDQARMANFVVSNTSKHKEEAVKALGIINSDAELLNGLVYGVEGQQWEKTGDKKIKLLPSYSEGVKHMAAWNTGNNAILYTTDAVTNEMITKRDQSIKDAKVSPLLGFTFDQSKVKSEISNLSNVMSQYLDQLNTGSVDPVQTLPKLKAELKKAGYDKVQKEMQSQYDTYLKNK